MGTLADGFRKLYPSYKPDPWEEESIPSDEIREASAASSPDCIRATNLEGRATAGPCLRQSRPCRNSSRTSGPDERAIPQPRTTPQTPRPGHGRRPPSLAPAAPRAAQAPRRRQAGAVGRALPGLGGAGGGAARQRAGDALRRRPAHRRQARRDQGGPGKASGAGDRRRDRLGQDHPVAEDLPGDRPWHPRPDRPHPAAPAGGTQRGDAGGGGDRQPPGRTGGLPGALRGPVQRAQPDQADDRRHPAGRNPARPLPRALRHHHRRRSPRAQPEHRLPAGLPEDPAAAPPRPQADHHLGHHRPGALLQAFR
ncbi:hypothetical protein D3C78_359540 [compost metagenome]